MKVFVDKSLASGLATRSLSDWIRLSADFERGCSNLGKLMAKQVASRASPVKIALRAFKEMNALIYNFGLPTERRVISSRRTEFHFCFPEACEGRVTFVLGTAEINARTGAFNLGRKRDLESTRHALERLHQRMSTIASTDLVREVFSCRDTVTPMREAAREAGAYQWPLPTARGMFVCAPSGNEQSTALVTWIRSDQLGRRWGTLVEELGKAGSLIVEDPSLTANLLRANSWLLRPHVPGVDTVATWWSSRSDAERIQQAESIEESIACDQQVAV